MPCLKDMLLLTMVLMTLILSLRAEPEAFSETGEFYGAVSENPIHFGELLIGVQDQFHLAEAKLHRLGPSVHCGNDSMTLHIPGAIRTPHFLVNRGDESIVPLSEMPARCGFSLKRARRDVSLVAPYQGCHVRRQGGSYVLPLFIMGAPVRMSCPVSSCLPKVSCFPSSMTASLDVRANDIKVKVDGSWQPLLLTSTKCSFALATVGGSLVVTAPFTGSCWEVKDNEMKLPLMYGDREVILSCPVTAMPAPTTTAPVQDPLYGQPKVYPFPSRKPWWHHPHSHGYPVPATMPPITTTNSPPVQDPSQYVYPQKYPMSEFDPTFQSSGPAAQWPRYPMLPPHLHHFKNPADPMTPSATAAPFEVFPGYPPLSYGPHSFVPPGVKQPSMPRHPQDPGFTTSHFKKPFLKQQ